MNTISNVAVLSVGIAALTKAVELASTNVTGAIIAAVIGLAAILLYERMPLSNPPPTV